MIYASLSRLEYPVTTSLTIQKCAGIVFFFMSLFPWVSFGTNDMDSQPWALMLALVFLFTSIHTPINSKFLLLLVFIPAVIAVGLWDRRQFDFPFYRAIFSYGSVPFLTIAYYVYVKTYGFPLQLVKAANVVYLVVAGLQQLLGPGIIGELAELRTSADRGMPSLAAEPTYFGILLVFFAWIISVSTGYRPRGANLLLVAVNTVFLIFVAKSSMAILFLGVAIGLVVLYRIRPALYFGIALSAVALVVGYGVFLQETRIGTLVRIVQAGGLRELVMSDASINVRVAHLVIPWYEAISSLFVPHGFSAFSQAFYGSKTWHGGLFWYGGDANIIMSYAGAFVFELGLVGLVYLGCLFSLAFEASRRRIFELAFLFVLVNSAIPVAFPLIPLVVVLLYFSSDDPRVTRASLVARERSA